MYIITGKGSSYVISQSQQHRFIQKKMEYN